VGSFYHVYNRGVDKKIIYKNDKDRLRFIGGMESFNASKKAERMSDKFVDVICFCLMPNHFHLLLRCKEPNGITNFMRRLSTGYTMYFNKKYDRQGVLFESNYKFIEIENEDYLLQLSRYIHLNPLSLVEPRWKDEGIGDFKKAFDFLKEYKWSSLPEYLNNNVSTGIVDRDLLLQTIGGVERYEEFMRAWDPRKIV